MKYNNLSILEHISDFVPAVLDVKKEGKYFFVKLRNNHTKKLEGIKKLHSYLGWLIFHDKQIK